MFVCLCFTAKPRRLFISICHYNKYHRYTLTHLDIHACRCLNVECFSFKFRRKHFCCICDAAVVVCCPLLAGRRVAAIVATFSWPLLLLMQRGGVHVCMYVYICLCVCSGSISASASPGCRRNGAAAVVVTTPKRLAFGVARCLCRWGGSCCCRANFST